VTFDPASQDASEQQVGACQVCERTDVLDTSSCVRTAQLRGGGTSFRWKTFA
jgi:hypothetical protein